MHSLFGKKKKKVFRILISIFPQNQEKGKPRKFKEEIWMVQKDKLSFSTMLSFSQPPTEMKREKSSKRHFNKHMSFSAVKLRENENKNRNETKL